MIRRNIVANAIGGTTALLLNVIVTPFLIKILGAEAYGLLGLMTSLQILFAVLDLGLSTTIIRAIASDDSADRTATRSLVQTLALVYWSIAVMLGAALFLGAGALVRDWLNLREMDPRDARLGIQILALSAALRWPVALYGGVIAGTQALVRLNIVRVLSAIVRLGGGLVVLLITRDLRAYLWWMALSSLIEIGLYVLASVRLHPGLRAWPAIEWTSLGTVWQFSLSMNLISILSLVFTQADRLMISRLRPLSELGYYSLAVNVVMSLSVIQGFITSAVMPALASDYSAGQTARLRDRYAKATQALIYVITLPACIFIFFGYDVLRIWTTVEAAEHSAVVLALFSAGFLLNASVSMAYTLSVASGHTSLPVRVNSVAVIAYVPGLYFATLRWGIVGAAATWVALNLYFLLTLLPLVEIRIAKASATRWAADNFLPFVGRGTLTFGIAAMIARRLSSDAAPVMPLVLCVLASVVYAAWGLSGATASLQADVRRLARGLIPWPRAAL